MSSHCVHSSVMLPSRSTTRMLCSHRQSTPSVPRPGSFRTSPFGMELPPAAAAAGRRGNRRPGATWGSRTVSSSLRLRSGRFAPSAPGTPDLTLGKHVHGHRKGPVLMSGKTLRHRLRPVRDHIVGSEDALPALQPRDRRESGAGQPFSPPAPARHRPAGCSAGRWPGHPHRPP